MTRRPFPGGAKTHLPTGVVGVPGSEQALGQTSHFQAGQRRTVTPNKRSKSSGGRRSSRCENSMLTKPLSITVTLVEHFWSSYRRCTGPGEGKESGRHGKGKRR